MQKSNLTGTDNLIKSTGQYFFKPLLNQNTLLSRPKCPDQMIHKNSLLGVTQDHTKLRRTKRKPTERFTKGIGYHLGRRRRLLELRRRMADFALAFGLFGIIAAYLDIEFISRIIYTKV